MPLRTDPHTSRNSYPQYPLVMSYTTPDIRSWEEFSWGPTELSTCGASTHTPHLLITSCLGTTPHPLQRGGGVELVVGILQVSLIACHLYPNPEMAVIVQPRLVGRIASPPPGLPLPAPYSAISLFNSGRALYWRPL